VILLLGSFSWASRTSSAVSIFFGWLMYVSVAHSSASVDQSKPLNDILNFALTERNTIQMHCNDSGKSSVKMTNYSKPVVTKTERKFPYNIRQNQLGFIAQMLYYLGSIRITGNHKKQNATFQGTGVCQSFRRKTIRRRVERKKQSQTTGPSNAGIVPEIHR